MVKVKKDISGKVFFKNDIRFAALYNAIFYDGKQVIDPRYVRALDSEESTHIETREHDIISKERRRDIIKEVMIDGKKVIMAIEIQQVVDKTMSLRVMGYDFFDYLNQLENGSNELLPVITLVLYCGEGEWKKAKDIVEMMSPIPKAVDGYVKRYSMNFMDIKDIDTELIEDEETRVVIEAIQRLYKFKDVKSLEGLNMTKKQLMVAGSLTNTEEVIKMAEEMEEGVKNVCSAFTKYVQNERKQGLVKGEAKGLAKGLVEGEVIGKITTIIELLTNKIGVLSEDTKERIRESNEEKLSKLIKQLFVIDSEEDILNIIE